MAVDKDYMPTGREYRREISESLDVILPADEKEHFFGLLAMNGDIPALIAFCAVDEVTDQSLFIAELA